MQEAPPFIYCAVNYFGPFYIKDKRKEVKQYGSLFTCLASRTVHIKVADSLDTDFLIMALRCFISLRGNIPELHSDWGTNFVGADRELRDAIKEISHEKIQDFLQNNGADYMLFKFKRNPPASSHMGGGMGTTNMFSENDLIFIDENSWSVFKWGSFSHFHG